MSNRGDRGEGEGDEEDEMLKGSKGRLLTTLGWDWTQCGGSEDIYMMEGTMEHSRSCRQCTMESRKRISPPSLSQVDPSTSRMLKTQE